VPLARVTGADGKTSEWRSASLRRTKAADELIAGAYLSGTNTRRVRRALNAVFAGPVGKDVVSRAWRKVKGDWDAWNVRPLGEEPIVRLILGGAVVRVRLDRKATSISLLVALGVRGESEAGVQAPDQDPDGAALRRNSRHVVLGAALLRPDREAQGRRMASDSPMSPEDASTNPTLIAMGPGNFAKRAV
jgi:hypothetical protein